MALSIKCLPHKHEILGLVSQNSQKSGMIVGNCNPNAGHKEGEENKLIPGTYLSDGLAESGISTFSDISVSKDRK